MRVFFKPKPQATTPWFGSSIGSINSARALLCASTLKNLCVCVVYSDSIYILVIFRVMGMTAGVDWCCYIFVCVLAS